MTSATMNSARANAKKYEDEKVSDAYLRGFDRGFNCASWQDLPEVGATIWTDADGRVTVTEENQWDIVQSLAYDGESNARQFSPFEFTASEFNEDEDSSEELWEAFDEGISDGINGNIQERMKAYQS